MVNTTKGHTLYEVTIYYPFGTRKVSGTYALVCMQRADAIKQGIATSGVRKVVK